VGTEEIDSHTGKPSRRAAFHLALGLFHSVGNLAVAIFRSKILFVALSVVAAMEVVNFGVESFDETGSDFVFRPAVVVDAVPMTTDHVIELFW
jgi:hypothetical protein